LIFEDFQIAKHPAFRLLLLYIIHYYTLYYTFL